MQDLLVKTSQISAHRRRRLNPTPEKGADERSLSVDIIEESSEATLKFLERNISLQQKNVLVLSSVHHYLYDSDDLEEVSSIINLKLINKIPHIRYFLGIMNRILPEGGIFVGRFLEYRKQTEFLKNSNISFFKKLIILFYLYMNRILPKIPVLSEIYYFLSCGKTNCLTREDAFNYLAINGFLLLNFEEIEGVIVFIAQKVFDVKVRTA